MARVLDSSVAEPVIKPEGDSSGITELRTIVMFRVNVQNVSGAT